MSSDKTNIVGCDAGNFGLKTMDEFGNMVYTPHLLVEVEESEWSLAVSNGRGKYRDGFGGYFAVHHYDTQDVGGRKKKVLVDTTYYAYGTPAGQYGVQPVIRDQKYRKDDGNYYALLVFSQLCSLFPSGTDSKLNLVYMYAPRYAALYDNMAESLIRVSSSCRFETVLGRGATSGKFGFKFNELFHMTEPNGGVQAFLSAGSGNMDGRRRRHDYLNIFRLVTDVGGGTTDLTIMQGMEVIEEITIQLGINDVLDAMDEAQLALGYSMRRDVLSAMLLTQNPPSSRVSRGDATKIINAGTSAYYQSLKNAIEGTSLENFSEFLLTGGGSQTMVRQLLEIIGIDEVSLANGITYRKDGQFIGSEKCPINFANVYGAVNAIREGRNV